MAIVFILSKKRQKTLLWTIVFVMVLILFIIPLIVFSSWFNNINKDIIKEMPPKPDIKINFGIIDSDKVKSLEPFLETITEFNYIANDKRGRKVIGKVLAVNQDEAINILQELGLKASSLVESTIGRKEPFTPYYQSTIQNINKK